MNKITLESTGRGPHVLISSGVHGDEYEPVVACLQLAHELTGRINKGKVTIVPIVNDSAFENASRFGEDGLDLARICPGDPIGSVSEKNASAITELICKCDYYVDLHTGGLMFDIHPLAGFFLHSDREVLRKQQDMAAECELPIVWGTEPTPAGRTISIARDANVPAIYLEYGGGAGFRVETIGAYKTAVFNILESFGMISSFRKRDRELPIYWVEDFRSNSGHLQVKMPAPVNGIFVPAVLPGDIIRQNELWGTIINAYTGYNTDVKTNEEGVVLMIRKLPKVKRGDSLGGILPITAPGKRTIHEN